MNDTVLIHKSKNLRVDFYDKDGDIVFVTFTSVGKNVKGFATDYLNSKNISAIHFISEWDHWWQPEDVRQAVEKVAGFIAEKQFRKIVTYGASMGGYGAALYARQLGATHSLLIAPQFTIQNSKPPHDRRWDREARAIDFKFDDMGGELSRKIKTCIVYDPMSLDKRHTALFKSHMEIDELKVCLSGHLPALLLQQTGQLNRVVTEFIQDRLVPGLIRAEARKRRRTAWSYWLHLSEAAMPRRPQLALKALHNAIDLDPGSTKNLFAASQIYSNLGKIGEAIEWCVKAIETKPEDPNMHAYLAGLYIDARKPQLAKDAISEAIRIDPHRAIFLRRQSHIEFILKNFDDSVLWAKKAIHADPLDVSSYLHLAGIFQARDEPSKTLEFLRKALVHAPENLQIIRRIEELYANFPVDVLEVSASRPELEATDVETFRALEPRPLKRLKILYISVHEVLQYDEVSLFEELGAQVHVGNKDGNPQGSGSLRPPAGEPTAWTEDTIKDYDVVIVMHHWQVTQKIYSCRGPGQRIIWRTIGQSNPRHERNVKKFCSEIEIVRYSPRERLIDSYAGEAAVIRFYKDPDIYNNWRSGGGISMLASRFGKRNMPDHNALNDVLKPFAWSLYGDNDGHPNARGKLDSDQVVPMLQSTDVYVSAHSVPACYTLNFIEALMTGCPVVTVGRQLLASMPDVIPDAPGLASQMYELDEIISHRVSGLLIDERDLAQREILELLQNKNWRQDMSEAGRTRAIELFGKAKIKEQWRQLLGL